MVYTMWFSIYLIFSVLWALPVSDVTHDSHVVHALIITKKVLEFPLRLLLKFEPMEGIEPTTPRLQITCSGQLSYIGNVGPFFKGSAKI